MTGLNEVSTYNLQTLGGDGRVRSQTVTFRPQVAKRRSYTTDVYASEASHYPPARPGSPRPKHPVRTYPTQVLVHRRKDTVVQGVVASLGSRCAWGETSKDALTELLRRLRLGVR